MCERNEEKEGMGEKKKRLIVEIEPEQWTLIQQKMELVGTTNFSRYARKMLIDGFIIRPEYGEIRALANELAAIGRNINQIAKRANETRSIYEEDVEDLRRDFGEVKRAVSEQLVKLINADEKEGADEDGVCENTRDNADTIEGFELH